MTTISLLYGKKGLELDLPNDVAPTIIRKHPMTPLKNPLQAVKDALENPVDSPPLSQVALKKKTACILICDITRPVPNGLLLPPIVNTLTNAGILKENILILIATGLHRPNEGEELREVVGSEEIVNTIRVENHFARDRNAHVNLGKTSRGIPIMIDRRFTEADVKIVTGLVEPHFMAGYSGGRKVVAPGVAGEDTILRFHTARILEHPRAVNCVMDGNPLHEEQIEIIRAIEGILSVNIVIDEERRPGFVNFGAIEPSHEKAVDFMRKHAEVRVSRRFRTVVTTSAGYPLDKTYYQTIKGMVGVIDILEPGGTILIAGECSEGMGSREFVAAQRMLCREGIKGFMTILETREKACIDEWQTEMLIKALRVGNIQLFTTGLNQTDLKDIHIASVPSLREAVLASAAAQGNSEIAVVPEGPYVIPLFVEDR